MAKQNKKVSIEVDAAALKSLQRASAALSELASAFQTMDDGPTRRMRGASRR